MPAIPKLTIGLPVFNGERYLESTIRGLLQQTFRDFRLLVLDNASTDQTRAIAERLAAEDPRIDYRCNERNIGAGPNFNRAHELAESELFKWAAYDDGHEPTYLERCIERLDADPTVVLAHSYVRQIDGDGRPVCADLEGIRSFLVQQADDESVFPPVPPEAEDPDPLTRFRSSVVTRGRCTEIFGVMRATALRGTIMHASFAGSDRLLLAELALRGRFSIVPAPLFLSRDHPERYSRRVFIPAQGEAGREAVLRWYDTSKVNKGRQMNWWIFFFSYFEIINRNVQGVGRRIVFYRVAATWLLDRWNLYDLTKDLLFALDPRLLGWATRQVKRLRRSAPV